MAFDRNIQKGTGDRVRERKEQEVTGRRGSAAGCETGEPEEAHLRGATADPFSITDSRERDWTGWRDE